MKSVQKIDLGLTGYDELFMNDAERKENKLPRIYDIPLLEIDDFPDHPFKVKLDEDMDQLVQSIKERGIITPVTLRPKEDGRYEIVSGHRRKKACELAGFDTVKAEVRELTRDEAIILMVESNLQRSVILPSEKAFSYKMRLEAMNRQGQRTDLTSVPVAQKSTSRELLGKEVGESQDQVRGRFHAISASRSSFRSFWIWLTRGALRSDRRWSFRTCKRRNRVPCWSKSLTQMPRRLLLRPLS